MSVRLVPRKQPDFLPQHSRVAEAVYSADWDSSPLGPIQSWPRTLKTALAGLFAIPAAKILVWGPHRIAFCNDASLALMGKAFGAIGNIVPDGIAGCWNTIPPLLDPTAAAWGDDPGEDTSRRVSVEPSSYFTVSRGTLRDDRGAKLGTMVTIVESAQQDQLKEILEADNHRFRELFDQAPVFVAVTSGPDFRFDYVNASYEELAGGRSLIGRSVAEAFPEIVAQGFVAQLTEVYSTGHPLIARDASVILVPDPVSGPQHHYVDFIFQPVLTAGAVTGVLIVGNLVTDHHLAGERLGKLREELDHAIRMSAMGTVAATLAHELNQPLAAIRNYVAGSRTRARGEEGDTTDLDPAMEAIGANADRAIEVIRRLRDMTQRAMVRKEAFDLEESVREAATLALVGPCAGAIVEYDFVFGARVCADRVQMQQVVLNLMRNGYESSEGVEGPVLLCISTLDRGERMEVRVADHGKGVAPRILPRLFEAFISNKPEGMGVGLSISRTIVESQGGRIWAESDPEGGTIFCFTLPKA